MGKKSPISGAILAGGKSLRMGTEKAFIHIGGVSLIERAIRTMKTAIAEPMIIANEPKKFKRFNLPVYRDIIPDSGPLGGLYTALMHARHNHVLLLACDIPSVTPRIVQELCARGRTCDILVLDTGFGLEPLCAVYSKRCLPSIESQIKKNQLKVTDFYSQMETVNVLKMEEVTDSVPGDWFFNINTPYDRSMAERIFKAEENKADRGKPEK